jgi:hypothetical protein
VTAQSTSNVIVTWNTPWTGGSIITSYVITFQHSDLTTYTEDATICDGSDASIISTRTCTIASSVFTQSPYNHAWGSSIYAKVQAINIKGESVESLAGNGAQIIRVPDAPISLANVASITSATTIGLAWLDGSDDGGSVILDYTISSAAVPNDYTVLEVGVTT